MRERYMTSRDVDMIRMLEEYNLIMTSDQIARMFYCQSGNLNSAKRTAQRRLSVLIDIKQIKRYRSYQNQSYIYYTSQKAPTKTDHRLLISETIIGLQTNGLEVVDIKTEYKGIEDTFEIRPDIYVTAQYKSNVYTILVECDITKKFTNSIKYINLLETWELEEQRYKKDGYYGIFNSDGSIDKSYEILHEKFSQKPIIVSVSKHKPMQTDYTFEGKSKSWKPIHVSPDFSNINNLIYSLPVKW